MGRIYHKDNSKSKGRKAPPPTPMDRRKFEGDMPRKPKSTK